MSSKIYFVLIEEKENVSSIRGASVTAHCIRLEPEKVGPNPYNGPYNFISMAESSLEAKSADGA